MNWFDDCLLTIALKFKKIFRMFVLFNNKKLILEIIYVVHMEYLVFGY